VTDEMADTLDNAADYIENHGWVQGVLYGPGSRVCAMGALRRTLGTPDPERLPEEPLVALLDGAGIAPDECDEELTAVVAGWNDDPARTKQEVLDAFRRAARVERGV
jgi:hypothetical protein